ncbi:MAG TPA: anti-sigma factor [Kofleriaceae bacterium]|jgi:hypothetical protein
MKTHVMLHPRAEELLVERALRPLSDAEQAELASLGIDADADDSFDVAAAAVMVATTRIEPMPADMFDRLAERTGAVASQPPAPTTPAPVIPIDRARKGRRVSAAWVAAAAAAGIVLATGAGMYLRRDGATPTATPAEARADLLGGGTRALAWTATADATAKGATGDVVWSDAKQRGYMRFVGLAANDPKAWQYQLWIFDRTRDQAFPVDGGVFDVSSTGEVIVPITAKLHVDQATLFAVTVERPGGVVVSKRERIVVTAKPS